MHPAGLGLAKPGGEVPHLLVRAAVSLVATRAGATRRSCGQEGVVILSQAQRHWYQRTVTYRIASSTQGSRSAQLLAKMLD